MKKTNLLFILLISLNILAGAQEKVTHKPIFDVHVHTMKVNPTWSSPMCPWFLP
ncbi:hypothetical protein OU798_16445 [Prolixibacteraceae bacterium Z1-6]|uniref:Amidohydrolase n=1 Tax=Draconibacterium aestuarii TaxID=2998507 RepID=A0A9X3F7P6_9BACT|nr:hypothetical protein [Prolixibacteraceae bacterium Z1-6]